ncbi:MAG: RNA polymerase subunit sigma [Marivirga sp.]|nr:RNA polymerase subunit sigma [Marivirga sp.]
MEDQLIPHLFRTEYQNMVSVLSYTFGIRHIEIAEDIVSDTFLSATETWSLKGTPDNPRAWLYAVAKNKIKNYLKRNLLFEQNISKELKHNAETSEEFELDMSVKNITDSQLAMIFTVCNEVNSVEAQVALALNLLCGFGIQEIADAFLTNKEVVYKRINRAKEKLKEADIKIQHPRTDEIAERLDTVLMTLYLTFSEGYYSTSQNTTLRKDFCTEAMRLNFLLIDNPATNSPAARALYALMCFHASRFDARENESGETILYHEQDDSIWDEGLIEKGTYYLNSASTGDRVTKYHLEAGIAYWHTLKQDSPEKWQNILDLYNHLLILEYSPIAALNRTFALGKAHGKKEAIIEAEKLQLTENPFYYTLLGNLYSELDNQVAKQHFETALKLTTSTGNRATIIKNIERLR